MIVIYDSNAYMMAEVTELFEERKYVEIGKATIERFTLFETTEGIYVSLDTYAIGTKEEIYESYRNSGVKLPSSDDPDNPEYIDVNDVLSIEDIFDNDDPDMLYQGLCIYTYKEFCDSTQTFVSKELFKDQGYVIFGLLS